MYYIKEENSMNNSDTLQSQLDVLEDKLEIREALVRAMFDLYRAEQGGKKMFVEGLGEIAAEGGVHDDGT